MDKTTEQLKARAYDILVESEKLNAGLKEVNREIASRITSKE